MSILKVKDSVTAAETFIGTLFAVFVILKLTNQIEWNWAWVLSPIWIPVALAAFVWVLYFILKLFARKGK